MVTINCLTQLEVFLRLFTKKLHWTFFKKKRKKKKEKEKEQRFFFFWNQAPDYQQEIKDALNLRILGPVRESNPGPLAPKARIMPLDQQAFEWLLI